MSDNCHGQSLLLFIQHILLIFHMLNVYFEKNAAAYKFFDICNKVVCSQQVYSKREEYHCKSIIISSCSFSLRAPVTYRYVREPKKNVSQEKRSSFIQSCSRFLLVLSNLHGKKNYAVQRHCSNSALFFITESEIPFQKHSHAVLSCIALLIMFLLLRGNCHFQRGKSNETQMFLVYCFLP